MSATICLIEGDGIGREVVPAAAAVLSALGLGLRFTRARIGYGVYQESGQSLPDETVAAIHAADATLFGAVTTPVGIPNYRSPVVALRRALDLYANLRPVQSLPIPGCRPDVNLWIVRENTEDSLCRPGDERRRAGDGAASHHPRRLGAHRPRRL